VIKKLYLLLFTISIALNSYSQKELWAYTVTGGFGLCPTTAPNWGKIIRIPLSGGLITETVVHDFDPTGIQGNIPINKMFLASNGKIYGLTRCTGSFACPNIPEGVLFEYDLILNKYRVISTSIQQPFLSNPIESLIEPIQGVLYGTSRYGNTIFKYNIATDIVTLVGNITTISLSDGPLEPKIETGLMLASDGNLYGTTLVANSAINPPSRRQGGIVKVNLSTNAITIPFAFNEGYGLSLGDDVIYPTSKLVEGLLGKLYGVSQGGLHMNLGSNPPNTGGTIYEYTIATNTISKKFDFDLNGIGQAPSGLIKINNNTLIGTLYSINSQDNFPNKYGSIYEYNFDDNQINVVHVFDNQVDEAYWISPFDTLIKGTDDNFYGRSESGIFRFDPLADSVIRKSLGTYGGDTSEPIEICRKPSYQEIQSNPFTPCVGAPFSYDIQNINATSYIWKKDGVVLPTQTTAILNIATLATPDNGVYTCTMTNECGTTITMPLQINASCLGIEEFSNNKNSLKLSPNPAKNILNISLQDNKKFIVSELVVTNLLGQQVMSETKNFTKIDVSKLAIGIYQLILKTDKGDRIEKFVKE
jgi:Secretion system C-terminal sorting domain